MKGDDEIVRDISGYETSRDYAKLWELAQRQSVVCVVDFFGGLDTPCRDIAQTIRNPHEVHVSVRGRTYAFGQDAEEFAESCERVNLEWIVPEKP